MFPEEFTTVPGNDCQPDLPTELPGDLVTADEQRELDMDDEQISEAVAQEGGIALTEAGPCATNSSGGVMHQPKGGIAVSGASSGDTWGSNGGAVECSTPVLAAAAPDHLLQELAASPPPVTNADQSDCLTTEVAAGDEQGKEPGAAAVSVAVLPIDAVDHSIAVALPQKGVCGTTVADDVGALPAASCSLAHAPSHTPVAQSSPGTRTRATVVGEQRRTPEVAGSSAGRAVPAVSPLPQPRTVKFQSPRSTRPGSAAKPHLNRDSASLGATDAPGTLNRATGTSVASAVRKSALKSNTDAKSNVTTPAGSGKRAAAGNEHGDQLAAGLGSSVAALSKASSGKRVSICTPVHPKSTGPHRAIVRTPYPRTGGSASIADDDNEHNSNKAGSPDGMALADASEAVGQLSLGTSPQAVLSSTPLGHPSTRADNGTAMACDVEVAQGAAPQAADVAHVHVLKPTAAANPGAATPTAAAGGLAASKARPASARPAFGSTYSPATARSELPVKVREGQADGAWARVSTRVGHGSLAGDRPCSPNTQAAVRFDIDYGL
jgi:hypothetical protein